MDSECGSVPAGGAGPEGLYGHTLPGQVWRSKALTRLVSLPVIETSTGAKLKDPSKSGRTGVRVERAKGKWVINEGNPAEHWASIILSQEIWRKRTQPHLDHTRCLKGKAKSTSAFET